MDLRLLLGIALACSLSTHAAHACEEDEATLRAELALRFSADDPGTLARRDRIEQLFAQTPAACAEALYERLGEAAGEDELSQLFHASLATATRQRLRSRLRSNYAPFPPLVTAIEALPVGAAEREHLLCWVEKMRLGRARDVRIIPWPHICPLDDPSCPVRAHPTAEELAALGSLQQVDTAPAALGVFRFLDAAIDYARIDDVPGAVELLRAGRRDSEEAKRRLAGDDLLAHQAALAEWIAAKEDDPGSLLYCPRPEP